MSIYEVALTYFQDKLLGGLNDTLGLFMANITMILIFIALIGLVIWLFKLVGGLLTIWK